jgi:hypothetical protein
MKKVEIKLIGQELSGHLYITKKGTCIMDINFNPNNPDFYSLTVNNTDGEPCNSLKNEQFVIVNEFSEN